MELDPCPICGGPTLILHAPRQTIAIWCCECDRVWGHSKSKTVIELVDWWNHHGKEAQPISD